MDVSFEFHLCSCQRKHGGTGVIQRACEQVPRLTWCMSSFWFNMPYSGKKTGLNLPLNLMPLMVGGTKKREEMSCTVELICTSFSSCWPFFDPPALSSTLSFPYFVVKQQPKKTKAQKSKDILTASRDQVFLSGRLPLRTRIVADPHLSRVRNLKLEKIGRHLAAVRRA